MYRIYESVKVVLHEESQLSRIFFLIELHGSANMEYSRIGRRLESGHECIWKAVDQLIEIASVCNIKDKRRLEGAETLCY